MKKFLAITLSALLIVCLLSFTACSEIENALNSVIGELTSNSGNNEDPTGTSDGGNGGQTTPAIVGTYEIYEFVSMYQGTVARARVYDKGAPFAASDGSMEIKADGTLTITLENEPNSGTWKQENGKYYATVPYEDGTVTKELVMEDENHVFMNNLPETPDATDPTIYMSFVFSRKYTVNAPADPEGTYKLFEVKKTENNKTTRKTTRVRVTDPNTADSADDMVITFNADHTFTATVFGSDETASGTWSRNGETVTITPTGSEPSTLTFDDGEWAYAITDVSSYCLKKV